MKEEKTTSALDAILKDARPQHTQKYLEEHADDLITSDHPFADYMRACFKEKNLKQQDVFIAADIPERYGYKLISGEKHTVNRDIILRLCLGARFSLKETQRALKLYNLSPLYAKIPRDSVLIIACNSRLYEMAEVDSLLESHGMEPLASCRSIS
ncbi:MAG: hypothetical protein K6B72_12240 [Lachnospiraceae bacterium]|nr:hypothetical protein [Lachnospiraceae bacterium]